jgi:ABC-type Fe3+ transport system, permease component
MSDQRAASVPSPLIDVIDVIDAPLHPAAARRTGRSLLAPLAPSRRMSARPVIVAALALLIGAPLVAVLAQAMAAPDGLWAHLLATVFWSYVTNTLLLCLGVGLITVVVGTAAAWLVSMYRFPGRRVCEWALVLPMAMPAYVLAYAYTDLLQFTGPVQTLLRDATGLRYGGYWFPEIHSVGGAAFVLGFALYPYVYLLARAAFNEQSVCALEVSRTLGCSLFSAFRRVALPMARPAIATGAAFALMETLADFGAVKYFGVQTYTTGIYRAWYATANPTVAAQLAMALLVFVFVVFTLERLSRRAGRHRHTSNRYRSLTRERLRGPAALGAIATCVLPVALGFAVPAIALLRMAADSGADLPSLARLADLARNTVLLGALGSATVVTIAVVALYALRGGRDALPRLMGTLCSIGYATPGVVIGIGILIAVGAVDRWVGAGLREMFGLATGLVLGGSLVAVVYGCLVRFFAVAYGPLEAAMAKIKPSYEDAARLLQGKATSVLRHVHLPLMRSSLVVATLIVFVDVMKELPATMILRPFNFDTLAIEAFQLATTERLDAAAVPSLVIVAVGLLPVIVLCREIRRSRPGQS